MKTTNKNILSLSIRYFILLMAPLNNLYIFYLILTPLTIYPVFFLLDLFFNASLSGTIINLKELNLNIELVKACIAGSAYYLLLILNISIPNIKINKRVLMIVYAFSFLLLINILRIFLLTIFSSNSFFGLTHQITWYLLSTLLVVLIWFSEMKFFKIKEIPIYTDIKFLISQIRK